MEKPTLFYALMFTVVATVTLSQGCGLTNPQYEPYDRDDPPADDNATGTDDTAAGDESTGGDEECPASALTAYTANIKSAVDGTCASGGCHGVGGGGNSKFPLVAEEDDTNRAALYEFASGTTKGLTDMIHSSSHSGGDQTNNMAEASIEAWITEEAKCAE